MIQWEKGSAPVTVIMISLNEAHNLRDILDNLAGWAQEVFLVDSYSSDDTIDIALEYGIKVVQREFTGFGEQWNFCVTQLNVITPWTMKIDPDERLTDELKRNLERSMYEGLFDGFVFSRKLFFMSKPLPVKQEILRVWRTGNCEFTDLLVNEHPIVKGSIGKVAGIMHHLDSPDLGHWFAKQNSYSNFEAINTYRFRKVASEPKLFGNALNRRSWLKMNFMKFPFRYLAIFLYCYLVQGAWTAGKVGYIWARLRSDVYRFWEYKLIEIALTDRNPLPLNRKNGFPDSRVEQF